MKVFALSDLHLGFAVDKPMDKFGSMWKNHPRKIEANWKKIVEDSDIVLVPGDISWGINFEEAKPDLDFLDSLPGRKFICRGNHDYWWNSLSRVQKFVGPSITVLQRNAVDCGEFVLAASKGWNTPLWEGYKPTEDQKLYERELGRMLIALKKAEQLKKPEQKLVYMMHFPPVVDGKPSKFAEYLSDCGVALCLYGHLHGNWPERANMEYRGVLYRIASADYLKFKPMDITSEVTSQCSFL
ncbi:MAG: metallophosphoesterase [Candidatus Sabulitectum sp.]|nr:metallophosphoesterase [Candidatus Sabulitectum sp.]